MNKMKYIKFIVLVVLLTTYHLPLITFPRCYAAFEDLSAGARTAGMSDVFCAVADNSEAIFVQPAGLNDIGARHFSVSYGRLFAGLSDDSVIANSILSFSMPISPKTGVAIGYKNTGLMNSYNEETILIGVGHNVYGPVSVGATLKHLALNYMADDYTRMDPVFSSGYQKSGFDFDLGLMYRIFNNFNLGYSRQNVMGTDLGLAQEYKLGSVDHLGLSYLENDLLLSAETVVYNDNSLVALGTEKSFFNKLLSLRFGFSVLNTGFNKITAGIGFDYKDFAIDYAIDFPVNGIESTSGTHYLTFSGFIGRPVKRAEPVRKQKLIDKKATTEIRQMPGVIIEQPKPAPAAAEEPRPQPAAQKIIAPEPVKEPAAEKVSKPEAKPVAPAEIAVPLAEPFGSVKLPPGTITYKVKGHETLPELAEKYYGKRSMWTKIYEANKDKIEKGSLKEGEVLFIPLTAAVSGK